VAPTKPERPGDIEAEGAGRARLPGNVILMSERSNQPQEIPHYTRQPDRSHRAAEFALAALGLLAVSYAAWTQDLAPGSWSPVDALFLLTLAIGLVLLVCAVQDRLGGRGY